MDSPETSIESAEVQPEQGQGQHVDAPSAVQPDSGQGQQGESSLYTEALSAVPEEHRQFVEPHFKEWDRKVQGKLTEAAQYRDQWQPYSELGIDQYDPEGLGALLELGQALSDPESRQAAVMDLARHFGLLEGQEEEGEQDPLDDLRSQLEGAISWQRQREEAEQMAAREQETLSALVNEWAEVEASHGQKFSDAESERLRTVAEALAPTSENPIKDAYALIRSIAGDATTAFVTGAPTQPSAAEPAGRAATSAEPVLTFEEAERLHRERRLAAAS